MKLALLIVLVLLESQVTLPFKPKEEFEIKLKYEFKQKPIVDNSANSIHLDETTGERERRTSSAMLPFVAINLRVLKLNSEEVKVKILDNKMSVVYNKRVKQDDIINLVLGFTDDMKDRVTPHEYTIFFTTADKKELSRILITVNEDGTFLVNDEKRGKF
jgi:hypothetical protein